MSNVSEGVASNPASWVRSSRCHSSSCCVEVRVADGQVEVRSSVTPERGVLSFASDSWASFIDGVRAGEFDI